MTASESRALSSAELLGQTIRVFRNRFLTFLGILLPAPVSFVVVSAIIVFALTPGRSDGSPFDIRALWVQMSPWRKAAVFAGFFASQAVLFRAYAATVFASSEFRLGRRTPILQAYGRIRRKHLRLFWILNIIGIFGAAGGPLILAPLVLAMLCAPAIPIAVLEDLGVGAALKRSQVLTEGGYGRIFLLYVLFLILFVAAAFGFVFLSSVTEQVLGPGWWVRLSFLVGFILLLFPAQLWLIALALNYYDQRVRKENWLPASAGSA